LNGFPAIWSQLLLSPVARRAWNAKRGASILVFRQTLRDPSQTDEQIVDEFAMIDPSVATSAEQWPDVVLRRVRRDLAMAPKGVSWSWGGGSQNRT
jgi:hypothetical protein